jgi:uncharacterized protein YpuA (DUF1002 family)
MFLSSFSAFAEEETPPGPVMAPLKKADKAPYTGVLLSPTALAQIMSELQTQSDRTKAEVDKVTNTERAQCNLRVGNLTAEQVSAVKQTEAHIEAANAEKGVLINRVKQLEDDYPNIMLWSIGGIVVGASIAGLAAFAVTR